MAIIDDINLTIKLDNGNIITVELEYQRVQAVIKVLGLEIDGNDVTMTRRKWKRENKKPISDKQKCFDFEFEEIL